MNCWAGLNGVRYRHYDAMGTRGFIYGGPVPFYEQEQRSVSGAIDWRESHLLTESNPYSGHTSSHQPLVVFGPRDQWGMHWYHVYNTTSQNKFFSDGTPKNCYLALNNDGWPDGGIVYDALSGARRAYFVGWEK